MKTAAVFGSNASGKSNLLNALKTVKKIVTDQNFWLDSPIRYWGNTNPATDFSITFQVDNKQFRYDLSIDAVSNRASHEHEVKYYPMVDSESLFCRKIKKDRVCTSWYPVFEHLISEEQRDKIDSLLKDAESVRRRIVKINDQVRRCDIKLNEVRHSTNEKNNYADTYELLVEKRNSLISKRRVLSERLESNNRLLIYYKPILFSKKIDRSDLSHFTKSETKELIDSAYQWFACGLFVVGTDDFYYPLNNPETIEYLSDIMNSLDVGIKQIQWTMINPGNTKVLKELRKSITEKDSERLTKLKLQSATDSTMITTIVRTSDGLSKFEYWSGEESVYLLSIDHEDKNRESSKITAESDGTRRLLELASILMPAKHDTVFLIDEIDRKMHPLLTRRLLELYRERADPRKQLIFTSHELSLMDQDLLIPDEIWLVDKGSKGSQLVCMGTLPVEYNDVLNRIYASDPSIIGKPIFKKR